MQKDINTIEKPKSHPLYLQLNKLAKAYAIQQISFNTCEICYKTLNLIACVICKNFYHAKCLNLLSIPSNFICPKCKQRIPSSSKFFNENSKSSSDILYEDVSTNYHHNTQKKKNDNSKNNKTLFHSNSNLHNPELNGLINNSDDKSEISSNILQGSKPASSNKKTKKSNFLLNKRKREDTANKKRGDTNSEQKNANDYNSSSKHTATPANHKRKNVTHKPENVTNNNTTHHNHSQPSRKEIEAKILSEYDHSDSLYKRRKTKKGQLHQCDMYEFQDRYTNQINFDEEEYERGQLKQVYSSSANPLDQAEIDSYLKTARLFWNYRNMFLEEELCSDFFEECDKQMSKQKLGEKLKNKIKRLMKELKNLVRRGVDLSCHYDEMALKMLHLCKYKKKVALLFLYKQLNPFIEEVEEGFKNDVTFFQSEIISLINDGDIELEE